MRDIFYENNCDFNFSEFNCKLAFTPLLFFQMNQKQESLFYVVVALVRTNNSGFFCL